MYCEFFGFKEKPFAITPNPRFIFLSRNHKEVFAHLLYGIRSHCGFIEVTGEVGTGKTTVLRTLLNQLQDDAYRLAFIFNPALSAPELLRGIHREFGISCAAETIDEMLSALNSFLLRENAAGRTVVLVIDEAQNLEPGVLEQIRLLSNLETETDKLIQIVLVGQPELGTMLSRPELRQLSQRITVRYHLRSMKFEDARAYIRHRIEVAGGRGNLFTPRAVKKIFRYSGGLPRLINIVCDRALLCAYAEDAREVSAATVSTAIRELRRQSHDEAGIRRMGAIPGLAVVLLALAVSALGGYLALRPEPIPIPPSPPVVVAGISPEPRASVDPDLLCRRLARLDEGAAAVGAFNALAALWKVETEPAGSGMDVPFGLQKACDSRDLRLSGFRGSLEDLLRLDTPALLRIFLPGEPGHRYLALTGVEGERARIEPALGEGEWIELESLRRIWDGRAYLIWKNYRGLPAKTSRGDAGEEIHRLQGVLRDAGVYEGKESGVYDAATVASIKRFQAEQGLVSDGKVGPQTLIVLYRTVGRPSPPTIRDPRPEGKE
jgi:general secretion pathway protein A